MGISIYRPMAAAEAFIKGYKIEHLQMGLQVQSGLAACQLLLLLLQAVHLASAMHLQAVRLCPR